MKTIKLTSKSYKILIELLEQKKDELKDERNIYAFKNGKDYFLGDIGIGLRDYFILMNEIYNNQHD